MRGLGVLLMLLGAAACGDDDGPRVTGDGGPGGGDGDGGLEPPACVGQAATLLASTAGTCTFDVPISFDPEAVNVVISSPTSRQVVCHTLRETGCTGAGWYWTYDHQIALCDGSCDALLAGGAEAQVSIETGCATASCGGGSCTQATGVCTHSTASQCCSGRCDGDSCGSGLWGPCPVTSPFGCFEGTCQQGYCRCDPSDLQCGAQCVNPMADSANCGACGNACTGGKTCEAGACVCPGGLTDCNGVCVDDLTDEANCGTCGTTCRTDQVCSGGSCGCPGGQTTCNGTCVSTAANPMHCGGCNVVCDANEVCAAGGVGSSYYCVCMAGLFDCGNNGTCEDRMTDENHCGACNNACPGNKQCVGGVCT